ncbi:hypothetical protein NON20_09930 [Synechocystis sp. B12]|nr:hypothetical protein NON20_09930 [Synechocystis sp. B12]
MGRNSPSKGLHLQFKDARPQAIAEEEYFEQQDFAEQEYDPGQAAQWIEDNSFNFQTYQEIFSLPPAQPHKNSIMLLLLAIFVSFP